jgi:ElaB/YqjD/DUF883 family membrane-anchored ribosome-binding protein
MTDYHDPEAEQIVIAIEETRTEMGATIDEIGHRLQPQTIATEARDKIREATVGRVERIVDDAGKTAQQTSNTFVETIRQNPVPAALAALGIGWLAWKAREQPSWRYSEQYGYTPRYSYGNSSADRARDVADDAASRVRDAGSKAQQQAQAALDDTQQKLQQAQWQAQATLDDTVATAQTQWDRTLNENPLALGALAIGVGAAVALAIPSTQAERELVGEHRDRLVDQAASVASDVLDQTKAKAEEVGQQIQAGA